jgi:hypothetical protein
VVDGAVGVQPILLDLLAKRIVDSNTSVAVGTALSGRPPHRSVLEGLLHTALTSGV